MRFFRSSASPQRLILSATAAAVTVSTARAFVYSRSPASAPGSTPFSTLGQRLFVTTMADTDREMYSWAQLEERVAGTPVGKALNEDAAQRAQGFGAPHVSNTVRKFGVRDDPPITVYRDKAGWCPYCQKTMLLIEEKKVPVKIGLVPMRSYGDKPTEFTRKVPGGLLPAMEVNGQVITESSVIMELLDRWHGKDDDGGYAAMMPATDDNSLTSRYTQLARLERELFSWWCTLVFRPEGPGSMLQNIIGRGGGMSPSMQGFLDCLQKVDAELGKEEGPWFFGPDSGIGADGGKGPSMIDFVYLSHVERMAASVAFWKGVDLRQKTDANDPWHLPNLGRWLDEFDKRDAHLAFKSDYYTHIKDIPPQYGPSYDGGYEQERKRMSSTVLGKDGSWHLPLPHDDPLQPLYRGLPLPRCVMDAINVKSDENGSYEAPAAANQVAIQHACRLMASWKLAGNGANVAKFASRGGPKGAKNPRKTFGAELADPYANPDESVQDAVDAALRVICGAMGDVDSDDESYQPLLRSVVPAEKIPGVISSLEYVRDRVGVPRDLPLASARYLRAYLNWGIDTLGRR